MKAVVIGFYLILELLGQSETLLEQAEQAFRSGNLEQAQTLARRVLAKTPGSPPAHMILGVIAAQGQKWDAANLHFGAVVRPRAGQKAKAEHHLGISRQP